LNPLEQDCAHGAGNEKVKRLWSKPDEYMNALYGMEGL
jgi:hypothetical protein